MRGARFYPYTLSQVVLSRKSIVATGTPTSPEEIVEHDGDGNPSPGLGLSGTLAYLLPYDELPN